GDVDLPAAELAAVEAPGNLADDLFGRLIAGCEVGVGHARQRRVPEALAAARTGRSLPRQLGVEVIVEVALENSLFDQDLALAGIPLVVHVDGAASAGHGAVVDHGDQLTGYFLAQLAGEERGPLADEVGLQAMPHRFVEKDSAPPRRQHHRLRTGGSIDGTERRDGLARRLAADLLGREILEKAEVDAAAAAVEAGASLA